MLSNSLLFAACRTRFRCLTKHHRGVPANSSRDEERDTHAPLEPCELPDDIRLVYADERDRRGVIALEDAALLDFSQAKSFRKPPGVPGPAQLPGLVVVGNY